MISLTAPSPVVTAKRCQTTGPLIFEEIRPSLSVGRVAGPSIPPKKREPRCYTLRNLTFTPAGFPCMVVVPKISPSNGETGRYSGGVKLRW